MRMETQLLVERYRDNLFAVAFHVCENAADADDVVQDTFLCYHTSTREFDSEEHIKAWLIRAAIHRAVNVTRSWWRRRSVPLEEYVQTLAFPSDRDQALFQAVMGLPEKYRVVIHLFYYEDYSVREIAEILHTTQSNVKVRLSRARGMLKTILKEDWSDDE